MYFQIMSAAMTTQKAVADVYNASGRERSIGVYMLVVNHSTQEFFKTLKPDALTAPLHSVFLRWLAAAGEALAEEVELGEAVNSQRARDLVTATKGLAAEMDNYARTTQAAAR